jgi:iron complex transport system ATP-binding protein
LIALRDGEIVAQGAPKEIVTPELIERIYGMRCMIIDDPVAGTPLVVPLGTCGLMPSPYPLPREGQTILAPIGGGLE